MESPRGTTSECVLHHTVTGPLTPTCVVTFPLSPAAAGKINLCSPDHVSLLVHRTFNASIPRHHIPQSEWAFEYGPAENDPEYGAGAAAAIDIQDVSENEREGYKAKTVGVVKGEALTDDERENTAESGGQWVHTLTGLPLGGNSGTLTFTVVG